MEEKHFKILIADENIQFRNTLASRLRLQGFTVELATGGFHILHMLEKSRDYSMLIFHEDMHDMPSAEVVMLIRTTKNKTELPIVFISQDNSEDEICEIILNGANEYVVKSSNFQPIVDRAIKYFNLVKNS